jgi:hypothetical protein
MVPDVTNHMVRSQRAKRIAAVDGSCGDREGQCRLHGDNIAGMNHRRQGIAWPAAIQSFNSDGLTLRNRILK